MIRIDPFVEYFFLFRKRKCLNIKQCDKKIQIDIDNTRAKREDKKEPL